MSVYTCAGEWCENKDTKDTIVKESRFVCTYEEAMQNSVYWKM